MDAYTSFAQVYDLFMDNVPYEQWCAFLCRVLKKYGIEDGPVLDLGCGTGKLTRLMAKAGYDMTGVTGKKKSCICCRRCRSWIWMDVSGRYTVPVTA